jgi:hypothetical protein
MHINPNPQEPIMPNTRTLRLSRETKGALLYQEVNASGAAIETTDPTAMVGTLYIRKTFFQKNWPQEIKVTIEATTPSLDSL